MKILLFVSSIYNTLDDGDEEDYQNMINNLEKIKDINEDDKILVSFCDYTQNRNILLFHIRKIIEKIEDKKIYLGEQFLGDLRYKDITSPGILYEIKFNKIEQIINYVRRLQQEDNEVDLIIVDNKMNIEEYEKKLYKEDINYCKLINNVNSVNKINEHLEEIIDIKKKEYLN